MDCPCSSSWFPKDTTQRQIEKFSQLAKEGKLTVEQFEWYINLSVLLREQLVSVSPLSLQSFLATKTASANKTDSAESALDSSEDGAGDWLADMAGSIPPPKLTRDEQLKVLVTGGSA